jgi:ABC-type transport system involved in cytochrome bd biosynthesis fused ATPase/permease subunit
VRTGGDPPRLIRLKDGYDTALEEGGKPLSGVSAEVMPGPALLREGEIYLFDEPTSALDERHAEMVCGMLEELAKKALVIVISHDRVFDGRGGQTRMEAICAGI